MCQIRRQAQLHSYRPHTNLTPRAQELGKANQLKRIVFPTDEPPELNEKDSEAHKMYVRSHQAYMPGEQRR